MKILPIHTSLDVVRNDVLIDLYVNQGCSQKIVSDVFGVCKKTIRKRLIELGILKSRSEVIKLNWELGQKYNHEKSGFKRGKEHISWKGGRVKHKNRGYVWIYAPNHPRAKNSRYVLEHILIWEKANGKPLPKDYVIHHLNGVRDDNRIENLFACPRKRHIRQFPNTYIRMLQKRIRELEMVDKND